MRRINTLIGLTLGCFLALGALGCFGGGDGGGGGDTDCTVDADCNDNTQRCTTAGACVSKCEGVICNTGQTCEATTGNCTGGSGGCTVDADCNNATQRCDSTSSTCVSKCQGVVCGTGETCEPTTGTCGGGSTTCATDTDCDPNGDLGHVCDGGTCAADVFGDCATVSCLTGLDCLSIPTQSGTSQVCYEPCADSSACGLGWWCDAAAGSPTQGHCDQNLCGPQLAQYGYQGTPMMGTCDATATGAGDGVCMGPLVDFGSAGSPLEVGLCMATGSIAAGNSCPADATNGATADLCVSGLCLIETEGAATGLCRSFCTLLDGNDCVADVTGPTSCTPFGGLAGVCVPQSATPAAAGASCTASNAESTCVEDSICIDPAGGTATVCSSFCDTRVGTCPSGTCQPTSSNSSDMLGICI
ncbi:MAG: hypothetical protein P1V51_21985 [Deltaproteobacteria bacterium]|nr:hypothetical protein [Deltaproteobacteria bacterium]